MDYNKYKIGADKPDQLLAYYSFQRKSVKWWKKLFFHLFGLALVNAYILHRMKCKENFRLYNFKEKVAEGLVRDAGIEIKQQSQKSSAGRLMGGVKHLLPSMQVSKYTFHSLSQYLNTIYINIFVIVYSRVYSQHVSATNGHHQVLGI
jgi:hypothetical protein